jgi:hypothetical protein
MSRISDISHQYHTALSASQFQYEEMYRERVAASETFYRDFFHRLVLNFGERFHRERFRARIQERTELAPSRAPRVLQPGAVAARRPWIHDSCAVSRRVNARR